MKTIQSIEKDISEAVALAKEKMERNPEKKKSINSKLEKELLFYRFCLHFLERKPREEYLKKELGALNKKVSIFESRYETWLDNTPGVELLKNPELTYKRAMGLPKIEKQIKTLEYLLQ